MSSTTSVVTISDELSSEVATAILTRQQELNCDPRELLAIVLRVHGTLRELSVKARESRVEKIIAPHGRTSNSISKTIADV